MSEMEARLSKQQLEYYFKIQDGSAYSLEQEDGTSNTHKSSYHCWKVTPRECCSFDICVCVASHMTYDLKTCKTISELAYYLKYIPRRANAIYQRLDEDFHIPPNVADRIIGVAYDLYNRSNSKGSPFTNQGVLFDGSVASGAKLSRDR